MAENSSETLPLFTYSPEGILEQRSAYSSDINEYLGGIIEMLDKSNDHEIIINDEIVTVRTQIDELLPGKRAGSTDYHNLRVEEVINKLSLFGHLNYEDPRDGIVGIGFWSKRGLLPVVYPKFQTWLNLEQVDEDLANDVFESMLVPFGTNDREIINRSNEGIRRGKSYTEIGSPPFSVSFNVQTLETKIIRKTEKGFQNDEETWVYPLFTTLGSCACLSVDGMDRTDMHIPPVASWLYELKPHNIDNSIQSLSLALGLGRLAYEAAISELEQ